MQISREVSHIAPEFTLVRSGNQLVTTLSYGLSGYYDEELGYYLWDGEIGSTIGDIYGAYFSQTFDRPMDIQYSATLVPGVLTAGSYFLNDWHDGTSLALDFNVVLFSAGASFAGTSLTDCVFGSDFADNLGGAAGADFFEGGGGNDRLNGGTGADVMDGGAGNDTFYVDNAGDTVIEASGGGTLDWVATSVSYALGAGVSIEKLSTANLAGTSAIVLTGNEFAQRIVGNAGANAINGKGGADILQGNGGNDTYYVDNAGDRIIEAGGGGSDWVLASVTYKLAVGAEVETITTVSAGSVATIRLTGNEFTQTIKGNAGANAINGRAGNDSLTGGAGTDTFVFDAALNSSTNVDRITDFSVADDTIRLAATVFSRIDGTGTLTADQFVKNTSGLAEDENERIIYERDTGKLFYSPGDNDPTVHFATVGKNLALTNADFFVA